MAYDWTPEERLRWGRALLPFRGPKHRRPKAHEVIATRTACEGHPYPLDMRTLCGRELAVFDITEEWPDEEDRCGNCARIIAARFARDECDEEEVRSW
jgi:hypothetical protein